MYDVALVESHLASLIYDSFIDDDDWYDSITHSRRHMLKNNPLPRDQRFTFAKKCCEKHLILETKLCITCWHQLLIVREYNFLAREEEARMGRGPLLVGSTGRVSRGRLGLSNKAIRARTPSRIVLGHTCVGRHSRSPWGVGLPRGLCEFDTVARTCPKVATRSAEVERTWA